MFFNKPITSDQIALWIKKHFKAILFLLSCLIVAGIALIIWTKWQKDKEHEVQDTLYKLQKSLNTLIEEKEVKSQKDTLEMLKEEKEKSLSLTEDMRKKSVLYEQAIRKHKARKIAVVFAIDLADFYYRYQESEKSIKLLSLFSFPNKDSTLYHLASFQLANYYMDHDDKNKGCRKALEIFSILRANKNASPFHLESDLQQALCLEYLNRYEEALHKYESVLKEDPEGYSGRLAKDYKKLLILNKNLRKSK